ncbi:MAG: hypothetical protein ACLPV2_04045, partial [Steroidobacteraceae bacterium]
FDSCPGHSLTLCPFRLHIFAAVAQVEVAQDERGKISKRLAGLTLMCDVLPQRQPANPAYSAFRR